MSYSRAEAAGLPLNEPVPLEFVRALLVQARAYGRDVEAMLGTADFPFNPLDLPSAPVYVSLEQYSRLCVALFREIGDESGGVIAGSSTPFGTTRLLLYSVLHSGDLRAAMERAMEFNACCREQQGSIRVSELRVDDEQKMATLSYLACEDLTQLPPQDGSLCALSMWLRLCGWMIGQYIDIVAAECAGPEPESMLGLRHFFPCPVEFNGSRNSVTFSARHLSAPLIRSEAELETFLRVAPYHVVIKPVSSDCSITNRIHRLLGEDFRDELPNFEKLTQLLNMSPRTLRRRLEKEGTSYQRIKDNARRDVAIGLLCRERLTVSEVAERVGFSDPSAFHRSFKKWTGLSPGAYR